MNRNIQTMFLLLVILQAIHSAEEFIFRLYERLPPMKLLYQNAPYLAKPAFVIFNASLILIGLACFYYWVQPARKGARVVVWAWVILESLNVAAHLLWASIIGGYVPGLWTAALFIPVLIYLFSLMRRVSSSRIHSGCLSLH